MNNVQRGAIISRLMSNPRFKKGSKAENLVVISVIVNCDFSDDKPWGICSLTPSEMPLFLGRRFRCEVIERALYWAHAEGFIRLSDRTPEAQISVRRIKERPVRSGQTEPAEKTPESSEKASQNDVIDKKASKTFLKTPVLQSYSFKNLVGYDLHAAVGKVFFIRKIFDACSQLHPKTAKTVNFAQKTVEKPVHNSKFSKISLKIHCLQEKLDSLARYYMPLISPPQQNKERKQDSKEESAKSDCSQLGDSDGNQAPSQPWFLIKPYEPLVLTKENGITPDYVGMMEKRFRNINVEEELELLDSKIQLLKKHQNTTSNYQKYAYKCLETINAKKEGLCTNSGTVSPFICLERLVGSRSVPALCWEHGAGQDMIDQTLIPFLIGSEHECQTWNREIHNQNLSKLPTQASLSNLRQPTTIHQAITCFLRRPSKLFTIVGPSGSGKSYISILAIREMFRRKIPFKYLTASDLHILATTNNAAAADARRQLTTIPLLVVEDVIFEIKHYSFVEILCSVLNCRLKQDSLSTILTTRLRPALLLEPLGETLANAVAMEPWIILK